MRGKPFPINLANVITGITPADAGKTCVIQFRFIVVADHPRGCGENLCFSSNPAEIIGSPPRMRGKPPMFVRKHFLHRITPADAGKTVRPKFHWNVSKDHPRGCGENMPLSIRWPADMGSPPRMRGKHAAINSMARGYGITPADAGKTHHQFPIHREYQDHPRGCGENVCS